MATDWNPETGTWKNGKAAGADVETPSPLWIFGYGSLCWKSDFKYAEKQVGYMPSGWKRFFWQKSCDHRGTPSNPGLVLTVVSPTQWPKIPLTKEIAAELEGVVGTEALPVCGVCYRVADEDRDEVLDNLDFRETGGYSRDVIDVKLVDGRVVRALMYTAMPDNPNFECSLTLTQTADRIATAVGPSGANSAYLLNFYRFLASSAGKDRYISRLANMVQKRLAAPALPNAVSSAAKSGPKARLVLIGDLGGTNCRLNLLRLTGSISAHIAASSSPFQRDTITLVKKKYPSASATSLLILLKRFLVEKECAAAVKETGAVSLCSLSVCGPVTDGRYSVLLAPAFGKDGWRLDGQTLSEGLGGCKVLLLNDFHAVGLSLPHLPKDDVHTLHEGRRDPKGVIACLGPGTGLGEVFAVHQPKSNQWSVCCSEGGMSDFVARTDEEWGFRQWLRAQHGMVPVEMVVSGEGISNAYKWLRTMHADWCTDAALDQKILADPEPASVIARHGTPNTPTADRLCVRAVDMFLDTLGAEAGNLAIRYQASGGVFIAGGGIAGKLIHRIKDGRVTRAFLDKGKSVACYDRCPLYVCTTSGDTLGLGGAWVFASMNE